MPTVGRLRGGVRRKPKLLTEAPIKGGPNYEGRNGAKAPVRMVSDGARCRKAERAGVEPSNATPSQDGQGPHKIRLYAGIPVYPPLPHRKVTVTMCGVRTIRRKDPPGDRWGSSETSRRSRHAHPETAPGARIQGTVQRRRVGNVWFWKASVLHGGRDAARVGRCCSESGPAYRR